MNRILTGIPIYKQISLSAVVKNFLQVVEYQEVLRLLDRNVFPYLKRRLLKYEINLQPRASRCTERKEGAGKLLHS